MTENNLVEHATQISTPPKVETHLGTLEFPLGVPTEDTARRIYDNLDQLHAINAFLNALPGVNLWAMRRGFHEAGVGDNDVIIWPEMMDSASLVLAGSSDSLYFCLFADLTAGPVIIEMPPVTLTFVNDMWGRWIIDGGIGGPDRGMGGKYLLVPPGYSGPLPDGGFFVAQTRTTRIFLCGRAFLENNDPAPGVERVKQALRIYPYAPGGYGTSLGDIVTGGPAPALPWTADTWSAPLRRPAPPRFVDGTGLPMNTIMPNDATFYDLASELVHDQPAEALDAEIAGELAAIGIVKGTPFEPDGRMRRILAEAASVANATCRTVAFRPRLSEKVYYYGASSQWIVPLFAGGHDFMTPPARVTDAGVEPYPSDGARKLHLRILFYYQAWGVTPAMCMHLTNLGSQYLWTAADRHGRPLDGGRHYTLTMPPHIPAARFWSVTLCDNQTRSMLETAQRYPKAGSQGFPRPPATADPDGSITVHFAPERPDGVPEGNWVQTVPDKGWSVNLRLYSPQPSFFDKTWRPGEVDEVPTVTAQHVN